MGVLAQVAGGVGKGMVANVEDRREDAASDALRQHQEMLQKMRDKASMAEVDRRGEIGMEAYERGRKDTLSDAEAQRDRDAQALLSGQEREDVVREDEQEHNVDIEAMKQYTKMTESGSVSTKDGKWEMKVLTKGEMGPNGIPVEVDTFVVREPGTPFSFVQEGMTMLPHNYTDEQRQQALAVASNPDDVQKSDTSQLMKRAGSDGDVSSEFMRAYGYLPAEYFRKIRTGAQGPEGFNEFRKTFQRPVSIGGPQGGTESETIRNRMNAPSDPSQAFSPESENIMSTLTDEEYIDNFKAAGGTDENLAEAQRLGLLPSQRRGKLQGGQLDEPKGGMLTQARREQMGPPAPNAAMGGLTPEELKQITEWVGGQMNPMQMVKQ